MRYSITYADCGCSLCLDKIPKHYVSDGILKRNCLAIEH
jgi:hypothetical protein